MTVEGAELWESLIECERQAARLRAAVHHSPARNELLASALRPGAGVRSQAEALKFLVSFGGLVPEFVPQLFEMAADGRWDPQARAALAAGPREQVLPEVLRLTAARLAALRSAEPEEPDEYLHLAALLSALGGVRPAEPAAVEAVRRVAAGASESTNPEIREAGEDIRRTYLAPGS